ncbi:MAG: 2-polyprenyl-3-methyl-6-methoxy-1,4-benzoquinone monooxygenase [Gammaproteobacteria bacterium]
MQKRRYNGLDRAILGFDRVLSGLLPEQTGTGRRVPAATGQGQAPPTALNAEEQRHAAGLMRVNHAGEVAAQGLYHGQAWVARREAVRDSMLQAAREEGDHLHWCARRLQGLDSRTSYLDPLWYLGSFGLGSVAGLLGDRWSLGFIVETEQQVEAHLDKHLDLLPENDVESRAILQQIKQDEAQHAATAMQAGGRELPDVIKQGMRLCAGIMTRTAYYL